MFASSAFVEDFGVSWRSKCSILYCIVVSNLYVALLTHPLKSRGPAFYVSLDIRGCFWQWIKDTQLSSALSSYFSFSFEKFILHTYHLFEFFITLYACIYWKSLFCCFNLQNHFFFVLQGCYDKSLVYLEQHFVIITIVTGSVPLLLVSTVLHMPGEAIERINGLDVWLDCFPGNMF